MNNTKHWYQLGPFTIFDVETTGMSPTRDRIIEIAAIRVDTNNTHERFHELVNPERRIPPSASRVHHITDSMVAGADNFSVIGRQFLDFANDTTLVAHNARFDLAFLQESLNRDYLNLWQGKTMDTIPLIKRAFPDLPSYSLQYLRTRFSLGDGTGQAHRAFADVEWTLEILDITLTALLRNSR